MKKLAVAVALMAYGAVVLASCPPNAPYRCYTGYNGKQVCGCGV